MWLDITESCVPNQSIVELAIIFLVCEMTWEQNQFQSNFLFEGWTSLVSKVRLLVWILDSKTDIYENISMIKNHYCVPMKAKIQRKQVLFSSNFSSKYSQRGLYYSASFSHDFFHFFLYFPLKCFVNCYVLAQVGLCLVLVDQPHSSTMPAFAHFCWTSSNFSFIWW